ncbi:MAG: hypothetical protein CMJ58_25295 [Planctomycetaceae bacterium]|nr:hypothetical protein [Planctomycetaceae bacterium]
MAVTTRVNTKRTKRSFGAQSMLRVVVVYRTSRRDDCKRQTFRGRVGPIGTDCQTPERENPAG